MRERVYRSRRCASKGTRSVRPEPSLKLARISSSFRPAIQLLNANSSSISFLRIFPLPSPVSRLSPPLRNRNRISTGGDEVDVSFDVAFYHCDAGEVWKHAESDDDSAFNCELCTDMVQDVEVGGPQRLTHASNPPRDFLLFPLLPCGSYWCGWYEPGRRRIKLPMAHRLSTFCRAAM